MTLLKKMPYNAHKGLHLTGETPRCRRTIARIGFLSFIVGGDFRLEKGLQVPHEGLNAGPHLNMGVDCSLAMLHITPLPPTLVSL